MKKLLTVFLLIMACFIISCGNAKEDDWFDPWDKLEGGNEADLGEKDDAVLDNYKPDDFVDVKDDQYNDEVKNENNINLENLNSLPDGVSFENDELLINKEGTFVLSGKFNGTVIIGDCEGTIQVVLNGVEIETKDGSMNPALLFKKNSGLRVLTVKEGTINKLKDNVSNCGDDAEEAVIAVKKSSLTINGKGTLELTGVGENSSGIKVKKELTIIETNIIINCKNNGIKADEKIIIEEANINIKALGDGIKTDIEATNEEEKVKYTSNAGYGYIYIKNSNITIESGDDGIAANNSMYIDNKVNNTITILTNGGAPAVITETSSDNAEGKAIKVGGVKFVDEENDIEEDLPALYEENYSLVILNGIFDLNSNDDAVSSKGNLLIQNGLFYISTGNDGVHAEYLTRISGGEVNVSKCYEGVEGAAVEVYGGKINVVSKDDGINAANGDITGYDYHIYITGDDTDITVNAEGDGVDSNGWIKMESGKLLIYGPTNGGNGSLDSDRGLVITGGTLITIGSAGMNENPASNSTQCFISVNVPTTQNANSKIELYDENDNLILSVTSIKRFQSVILSDKNLIIGKKYKVIVGSETYEATLEKIGTAFGTNQMGGGNQGQRPPGPGGQRPPKQ